MQEKTTRISLNEARKTKSLSNSKRNQNITDKEIDDIIKNDPDLYELTDEELSEFQLAKGKEDAKTK